MTLLQQQPTLTLLNTEALPYKELLAAIQLYYDIQRYRIGGSNRHKAILKAAMTATRLATAVEQLKQVEDNLAKAIAAAIKDHPLAVWPMQQRGVGPVLTAALIVSGLDPLIDKPSGWWRYAGVGVVDGKNQRKRAGQKITYNMFLNRTLFVITTSWLKTGGFYAYLYYNFKRQSEVQRPDLPNIPCRRCEGTGSYHELPCAWCRGLGYVGAAMHHHLRASMLVQRVFLTHLQAKWREALGLPPPRLPYITDVDQLALARQEQIAPHEYIAPPEEDNAYDRLASERRSQQMREAHAKRASTGQHIRNRRASQ